MFDYEENNFSRYLFDAIQNRSNWFYRCFFALQYNNGRISFSGNYVLIVT